jgi:hypothetical protein
MDSIIIKHSSEFNQTKIGQRLDETMIECLKATATVGDKTGTMLATLLQINNLPKNIVMVLTRPWYRANMLANWFEKHSLSMTKEHVKGIIDCIDEVKGLLIANSTNACLVLMLLLTSNEPNIDKLLSNLDEIKHFFESFTL